MRSQKHPTKRGKRFASFIHGAVISAVTLSATNGFAQASPYSRSEVFLQNSGYNLDAPKTEPQNRYREEPSQETEGRVRLPDLGGSNSSIFSTEFEHKLGRAWLKAFRSQVTTIADPLLLDYTENLLYKLASKSDLQDRRLELVIVENKAINAFAVPGGVVGVHDGLFLNADNEAQFAGVLAHEIAHLSQRHFSRSVEAQRNAGPMNMAALLAGVILAATAGADVGLAAITAGQAASLENQLRFSREHEKEADRIGMKTLANAGLDPNGIPNMFEIMNQRLRYMENKPPEFLLTHPLTENRISDSRNRAREYPRRVFPDNLDFQLMKMRVAQSYASSPQEFIRGLERGSNQASMAEASLYGLALAYTDMRRYDKAWQAISELREADPNRIAYVEAAAEILSQQKRYREAEALLNRNLRISPRNYPLSMKYAEVMLKAGQTKDAEEALDRMAKLRPNDPYVWYQLAEARGLNGNIFGVHLARVEYFILKGYLTDAQKQLGYAYNMTSSDPISRARVKRKMIEVQEMKQDLKNL